MESGEVEARIKDSLPGAEILVQGKDCDFSVVVISDAFDSMSRLKRQQAVLGCFSGEISTGEIHALSVKTFTSVEWEASRKNELTQLS